MAKDDPTRSPTLSDDDATLAAPNEQRGDGLAQVGPYRLVERIGEGGMGEVWLAEQESPRRQVALKVVKAGMDTKQVLARFEAERQALAMMDHPAIAHVYDAGATPRGRPYFAMEHVQGIPITEHCDRHRLTNRERLELFLQVCDGVQHAHQKAVIHRDLKPSNVLVSIRGDQPVPKIIDFGLAKATGQKLTEQTLHTQLGSIVGTPEYMSPEQAELTGQDVDTRTDVYSLGVMLYELLVGALPFDTKAFREAGLDGMMRKIREDDPPRPSARLSTLGDGSRESAKARRVDLGSLRRELTGDLDWITLKALEKDRTRRYASPHELAADIRRYLADEPVLARPPSTVYRTKKFVRRHTWGVGAAVAGVVLLIAFGVTMAVQARRIASERDAARQAQADLESVVTFQTGMLSGVDPEEMGRRLMDNVTDRVAERQRADGSSEEEVRAVSSSLRALLGTVNATDVALDLVDEEILAGAVATLEREFSNRPLIDARLRHTVGKTYLNLGRYQRAEPQLVAALETRKRVLGAEHPDTLDSMEELASLFRLQGSYAQSEPLLLTVLEGRKRVLGAEHPDTLSSRVNLADVYSDAGRYAEAEPLYLASLAAQTTAFGTDHLGTLHTMGNLANLYVRQGRYAEAEPLYVESLGAQRRVLGAEHRKTLNQMQNLAGLYWYQGRYAEAEPLYRASFEALSRTVGTEHPQTLETMTNLGGLYLKLGSYEQAASQLEETVNVQKRVYGDSDQMFVGWIHYYLGCLAAVQGQREQALGSLREAVSLGWAARDLFEDAELDSLRGDPEFKALVADVEKRIGEKP